MYDFSKLPKGRLTPQKVKEIYKKHGEELTLEQAEKVLEFIRRIANIAVDQVLRQEQEKAGQ